MPYIAWALAYQSHALATASSTYLDANIFHPARRALLYGEPGLAALPLFAPVFLASGNPTAAINFVLLGGLVLTALGIHLAVERWVGSWLAGLVAGTALLTNPWCLWQFFPSAPSYAVLPYFPWIVFFAARLPGRFRDAGPLAAAVLLQCLAGLVYVTAAVLGPLGLLALARLARQSWRRAGLLLLAVVALVLLVLSPLYAGYLGIMRENVATWRHEGWAGSDVSLPPDVARTVMMVGGWPRAALPLPYGLVRTVSATWIAGTTFVLLVAGALCAFTRRRERLHSAWLHGLFWVVAGLLMSTPVVTVFGSAPIVLPHFALAERAAPVLLDVVRDPPRLGLAGLIGVAMLAGTAFAAVAERLPARRLRAALAVVVVAALYAEYRQFARAEMPLFEAVRGDSEVVRALRRSTGPVLELPDRMSAAAMHRSVFHWRPLINGYSSYRPAGYVERMALAARLPDSAVLAALCRETALTTVVVHLRQMSADAGRWLALARGGRDDLRLVAREADSLVFEVTHPACVNPGSR